MAVVHWLRHLFLDHRHAVDESSRDDAPRVTGKFHVPTVERGPLDVHWVLSVPHPVDCGALGQRRTEAGCVDVGCHEYRDRGHDQRVLVVHDLPPQGDGAPARCQDDHRSQAIRLAWTIHMDGSHADCHLESKIRGSVLRDDDHLLHVHSSTIRGGLTSAWLSYLTVHRPVRFIRSSWRAAEKGLQAVR